MSRNQSYWENRKARELYEELVSAEDAAEEMRQVYIRASNEVQAKARKIVKRFQLKHGLSNAAAERLLNKITSPDDIDEIIKLLKLDPGNADLIAELEAPAYSARLRRLSAVQASIDQVARSVFDQVKPRMQRVLEKIGRGMYYRQIFEMQQRANAAFSFTSVDEKRLEQVLQTRWSGANFSERLWGNTEELAAAVKEQILLGILTGKSQRAMSEAIDGRFSKGSNATRRLVRTEANYVANQMQIESYKQHGVEKYIYVAILDLRTSLVCRELDKKVFKIEDAMPGENYPPMHPWCRSTTIAWMPASLLRKLRQAAIDPATGETVQIPGDMTYREWYDKYVRGRETVRTGIRPLGEIDTGLYRKAAAGKIRDSEVIITDKQIGHIDERRGDSFYEKYGPYFSETIVSPDYIFADPKHSNTALAAKKLPDEDRYLLLALRLATKADIAGIKNSVITAMRISNKRLIQYTRSHKIVYKK